LLDKVLRTAGVTDPAKLKEAALALDIPAGGTSLGWGVKFVRPGSEMQGQNERSFPVAQQWQDGKLVVVAPDNLKTGDPVLVPLRTWDKR
jgi:branched-chain amino acid transport system substrate-binding protein